MVSQTLHTNEIPVLIQGSMLHCRNKCLGPPLFQYSEGTITSAEINDRDSCFNSRQHAHIVILEYFNIKE